MLITIYAPSNVHLLEIAGLRDAFFEANCKLMPMQPYQVRLITADGAPTQSASGVRFLPDGGVRDALEPSDTLIVVGPNGVPQVPDDEVARWLRSQAESSRRFGRLARAHSCWRMPACCPVVTSQPTGNTPTGSPRAILTFTSSPTVSSSAMARCSVRLVSLLRSTLPSR